MKCSFQNRIQQYQLQQKCKYILMEVRLLLRIDLEDDIADEIASALRASRAPSRSVDEDDCVLL